MNSIYKTMMALFTDHLLAQNYSKRTQRDYHYMIRFFFEFLSENEGELHADQIRVDHLREYHMMLLQMEFRGKPLNVRTIHFRLGVVKTFFKFMHKSGRIYHDPMANYTLPKQPKTLPRNIGDVAEVRALIECPNVAEPLGKRDKALLELVYSCGLRNQEVRSLELRHLDLKGRQLRVLGKGGSENVVPFGECAGKALEDYLLFGRGELVKKESEKDFLFLSNLGLPISTEALRQIFMKYCKKAGIEKELRAHSLRHSCATHLLQNGADIRHIQRLLRHQSLDTTQIYTRVDVGDLRQAQLKYHPREQR